jgi:hypothetical protein
MRQGGGEDAGGPGLEFPGELAGGFAGADRPDPWELDVSAVGGQTERAGGEPAAAPGAAALEPGRADLRAAAAAGPGVAVVLEGGRGVGQPGGVGLLAVLRPPRRDLMLRRVPCPAQVIGRARGELGAAQPVAVLGGALRPDLAGQLDAEVVGEPLGATVRPVRLLLGGGRVQREQEGSHHIPQARTEHRHNPARHAPPGETISNRTRRTAPTARADQELRRTTRHRTAQRYTFLYWRFMNVVFLNLRGLR